MTDRWWFHTWWWKRAARRSGYTLLALAHPRATWRFRAHEVRGIDWSCGRIRWCCKTCGRHVRFLCGTTPYHEWWWL